MIYTLDRIRLLLQDRRLNLIADATGIHVNTIRDIRDNPDANPTYKVLVALNAYLESTNAHKG
jgi:hypothetical protein